MRQCADFLDAFFGDALAGGKLPSESRIGRINLLGGRLQADFDRGHRLAKSIVQIAADAPAFFVLQLQKARRELTKRLLPLHSLRHIASDFSETDQVFAFVAHGSDNHIGPESGTILANTPALIFKPTLAEGHFEFASGFARAHIFFGIKAGEMPSDDFRCRVTFDAASASIPAGYIADRIKHKDGVILNRIGHQAKTVFAAVQGDLGGVRGRRAQGAGRVAAG